ncbi:uncharacterized protein ISCGN_014325 [Ixodes scapularis]
MEENSPGRKKRCRKRRDSSLVEDRTSQSLATGKDPEPQSTSRQQPQPAKPKDSTRVVKSPKRRLKRNDQQTDAPDDLVGHILKASTSAPKVYVHRSAERLEQPASKSTDGTAAKKPRKTLGQALLGKLFEVFSRAKEFTKPSSHSSAAFSDDEESEDCARPRDASKRTQHLTTTLSKTDVRSRPYELPARPSLEARRRAAFELPPQSTVVQDAEDLRKTRNFGQLPYCQASASSSAPCAVKRGAGSEFHSLSASPEQKTFPGSSSGVAYTTFSENRLASPDAASVERFLQTSEAPFPCETQDEEMEDLSDVISQTISQQAPLIDYKGLYLVTDTNLFIHNLDLLRTIASTNVGSEELIVCIPWVVIQELDNIKNRKRDPVWRDAAAAISFIYQALASKNPRVRGQTIAEARTKDDVLPGDILNTNDDHLLHCCLSLKEQGSRVVLVSNDLNLRNKALINHIPSWSAQQVESNLRQRLGSGLGRCILPEEDSKQEVAQKLDTVSEAHQSREETCNEMCNILRGTLTLVLESELKSAFGDLWLRVVAVKPPWTEVTALECLLKHWIALTGLAFKRTLKPVVENLVSLLKSRHELLDQLDAALGLSIDLCSELQLHYFQLAEDVSRLRALRRGLRGQSGELSHQDSPATSGAVPTALRELQRRPLPPRVAIPPPRTPVPPPGTSAAAASPGVPRQVVVAVSSPPSSTPPVFPRPQLLLQETWELVNDFCGTLCKSLKRPHGFAFVERPSLLKDRSRFGEVYRQVAHAMGHMDMILKTPEGRRQQMQGVGNLFVQSLMNLLRLLSPKGEADRVVSGVTEKEMLEFLSDSKYKELVFNGHKQLVILHDTIGDCVLKILSPKKGSPK